MRVFLTGGTGLLGGELLATLAAHPEVERIHALVRTRRGVRGAARLRAVFELRGDRFDPDRVVPIEGDLLDDGLPAKLVADSSLSGIKVVIHAAANTSFLRMNDALVEETNVTGLDRVLTWAGGLRRLDTFLYIGTAMSCGTRSRMRPVDEDESPDPTAQHLVRYTRSKMRAEMMLRRRLPAERILIARPSIILGDSRPVAPRFIDVLWVVAAMNRLRLVPVDPDRPLDIIPVDHAAAAIAALLFASRRHDVYHVSAGPAAATSARLLAAPLARGFADFPPFCFVPRALLPEMRRWVKGQCRAEDGELGAYRGYLDYWKESFRDETRLLAVLLALEPNLRFMELGHVFDNRRIAEVGARDPEPAHVYMARALHHIGAIDIAGGARSG